MEPLPFEAGEDAEGLLPSHAAPGGKPGAAEVAGAGGPAGQDAVTRDGGARAGAVKAAQRNYATFAVPRDAGPGGRGAAPGDTPARPRPGTPRDARGSGDRVTKAEAAAAAPGVPFRNLGVREEICAVLEAEGITAAFPIQELALPIALGGHDIIGQARTGTGKTLAFGIPLLQKLEHGLHALVVVPTRELAVQVAADIRMAGSGIGARVLAVYGGRAYEPQIEALRAGTDVVVGTPGRLLDLAGQRHLDLSGVRTLVLDEADKMLDLGFLPDVERILGLTPAGRQTMLFSATMPGEVVTLARRHLRQPTHVRAEAGDEPAAVPATSQHVFRAHHLDKIEVLARVLQAEGRGLTMVFCQTKREADQVASELATRGFAAATVHGDLGQAQRERALRAFRSGKVDVLVATDVAARGLDVEDVTHVINYECPDDEKAYLHRIGRTGRAGRAGVAVTFVDWRDTPRWKLIDGALGVGQPEPAETYSTSAHLYSELGIPRDATGTLPRAMRSKAGLEAEELEDIGETGRAGRRGLGGPRARERMAGQERAVRKRARVRRRTRAGREVVQHDHGTQQPGGMGSPGAPAGMGRQAHTTHADPAGSAVPERGARTRRRRAKGSHQQAS
jgi:superfamily II DNA/RNA helicase